LIEESKFHASIDTFAKKLYLTSQKSNLKKLKALIDFFLTIWQFYYGVDKRYDAFIASILSGGFGSPIKLPTNIQLLTWNYDFQFELALSNFFMDYSLENIDEVIRIMPGNNITRKGNTLHSFTLSKLNGTALGRVENGSYNKTNIRHNNFGPKLTDSDKTGLIKECLINYHYNTEKENIESSISFAWENNPISKSIRDFSFKLVQHTSILVIIGYSFPTFNREIDRTLLSNMTALKKVYIQSEENSVSSIIQKFKALKPRHVIEPNTAINEFLVPVEF